MLKIGPFCVVDSDVVIGDRCRLEARVSIKSGVTLGQENSVGEGAVIGALAQHLTPPGPPGKVTIGSRNMIREFATIHRAMHQDQATQLGDDNLLMVGAHMAHDSVVGNEVVLTNNVLLAGHVTVGDRAYVGGAVAVHQFCRIGRLAMIGGCARVIQDIPPFVMIDGSTNLVVGLNRVGLRRAGIDQRQVKALKSAYQLIYRSGESLEDRLEMLAEQFPEGPASEFAPFLSDSKRGFARERRSPPGGTIRPIQEGMDDTSIGRSIRWAG